MQCTFKDKDVWVLKSHLQYITYDRTYNLSSQLKQPSIKHHSGGIPTTSYSFHIFLQCVRLSMHYPKDIPPGRHSIQDDESQLSTQQKKRSIPKQIWDRQFSQRTPIHWDITDRSLTLSSVPHSQSKHCVPPTVSLSIVNHYYITNTSKDLPPSRKWQAIQLAYTSPPR